MNIYICICDTQIYFWGNSDNKLLISINTLRTLSLSKCYTLKKKRLSHTVWIASKRKHIIRATELIIPILF